jgi:hypothetical protein
MQRWRWFSVLGAAWLALGCSDDQQRRGQVMVAVSTDMSIDSDLDEVQILVEREADGTVFTESFELFPNARGYFVPGTYAVVSGGDGGDVIRVRLLGRSEGDLRVARETVTTIPRNRVGMLPMPLQWLCESEHELDAEGDPASTCAVENEDETCNLGRCADAHVDGDDLEDFDPKDIYGGYDSGPEAARNGACFDAITCLSEGTRVEIDVSDPDVCEFERSEGIKDLNVGLVVEGAGHCNPITETCYIPLSRSKAFGWDEDGRTVILPPGVCDRLGDKVLAVVESGACPTKEFSVPTCGEWLGGDGIDADGDGVFDEDDNCPFIDNPDQGDEDEDGVGDACDTGAADQDADGVPDEEDNCPTEANKTQADADGDGDGDACDDDDDDDGFLDEDDPAPLDPFVPDADGDGLVADDDNCPANANPDQEDNDEDGEGDVCDGDDDDDGLSDKTDNCPLVANPDQEDCDGDDVGDACDVCDSAITITNPVGTLSLDTRVFNLSGNVGTLDLDSVAVVTESQASGRRFEQTVPVDANGLFNRQGLILNAGANTVTAETCNCVSDPVEITANVDPATMLVTLTWGQDQTDLDLYVYEPPPGEACYFDATCKLDGGSPLGGVLDVDKVLEEGYGPENYTLSSAEGDEVAPGDYLVRVHYFEGEPTTDYSVRILLNENDPDTESVSTYSGSLDVSNRNNATPSSTGEDWGDVAIISCEMNQNLVECTATEATSISVGGATGTGGAGGASGVTGGTAGASGSVSTDTGGLGMGGGGVGNGGTVGVTGGTGGASCIGCGDFLRGDTGSLCTDPSEGLVSTLASCACQSCASVCLDTLCTDIPAAPDSTCASCAREVCYNEAQTCDLDSATAGTGGTSGTGGVATGGGGTSTGGRQGSGGAGAGCPSCYNWYYANAMYADLCPDPSTGLAQTLSWCACELCPNECGNFCAPLLQGAGFPVYGFIQDPACSSCVLQAGSCDASISACTSDTPL